VKDQRVGDWKIDVPAAIEAIDLGDQPISHLKQQALHSRCQKFG